MNYVQTNCILTADVIKRKLRRMAFEIAERNTGATDIILAGIAGNGTVVAQHIWQELKAIISADIPLIMVQINKKQPLEVRVDSDIHFDNKIIILADDVANSGRTMLYALKPFLDFKPKSIQTLILVERSHKLFPVQSDYVGLSIATTLQEHIAVETEGNTITGAWLH